MLVPRFGVAAEQWTEIWPGRYHIAPQRHTESPATLQDRLRIQQYRSELEGERFRMERFGDPTSLDRQRQLQGLQREIGRVDTLLNR